MNNDRFLTRVWDTQEKRMIYKHKAFLYDGILYAFEAVTNNAIIASKGNRITVIELEDRFVPMMCRGLLSKNKKMIYEDDIGHIEGVFGCGTNRIISMIEGKFCFKNNDNDGTTILYDKLTKCVNIIGNCWENPELLEVGE
jgi:uncharacterized phage protein (TIGR01671 family)